MERAREISAYLLACMTRESCSRYVIYSDLKNSPNSRVVMTHLLPFTGSIHRTIPFPKTAEVQTPLSLPSVEAVGNVVKSWLSGVIYGALVSFCSEQSLMTAMSSLTRTPAD